LYNARRSIRPRVRSDHALPPAATGVASQPEEACDGALVRYTDKPHDKGHHGRSRAAYGEAKPEAASKLIDIWRANVFPDMKVTWGTYPSHLGHEDTPGCFRCHDGDHAAADGKAIDNDCATCHEIVASDEAKPAVLQTLAGSRRPSF
jgi:hypothetical protein